MTVLAAGMFAWLGAPDIPVSETSGNGAADGTAWIVMRRADLKKFGVVATSGLAWVLTWLWQPANVAYVRSQLLSVIVVPAVVLALLIWSAIAGSAARQRSEPLPRGTLPVLALVPPFAFITLVLWTRTPWIWTCLAALKRGPWTSVPAWTRRRDGETPVQMREIVETGHNRVRQHWN